MCSGQWMMEVPRASRCCSAQRVGEMDAQQQLLTGMLENQQGGAICIYDLGKSWPRGTQVSWCWLQLIPDRCRGCS